MRDYWMITYALDEDQGYMKTKTVKVAGRHSYLEWLKNNSEKFVISAKLISLKKEEQK